MTVKENNPHAYGRPDVTMLQSKVGLQNFNPEPAPEFHCSVCEGTGFLQTGHDWSPQACIACNSDTR